MPDYLSEIMRKAPMLLEKAPMVLGALGKLSRKQRKLLVICILIVVLIGGAVFVYFQFISDDGWPWQHKD